MPREERVLRRSSRLSTVGAEVEAAASVVTVGSDSGGDEVVWRLLPAWLRWRLTSTPLTRRRQLEEHRCLQSTLTGSTSAHFQ
jgi:hypothetical protein